MSQSSTSSQPMAAAAQVSAASKTACCRAGGPRAAERGELQPVVAGGPRGGRAAHLVDRSEDRSPSPSPTSRSS
ncbi:MAG: hypothetical protein IPN17_35030 [Deltaproteobacteria bacterium]|nr:hypothetical protein [Deltaproteobacteria bacterium]